MIDLDKYIDTYFSNGLDAPITLKKGGKFYIKPVLLKDNALYQWSLECLRYEKNVTDAPVEIQVKILQMKYLEFLLEVVMPLRKEEVLTKLSTLFKLTTHCSQFKPIRDKNEWAIAFTDENNTVTHIMNAKEFNEFIYVVNNQNDPHFDNRTPNPEVLELMQEYYKVKYANQVHPSLEKKKAFVCSKTGKTYRELGELTLREFLMVYEACLSSEVYLAQKVTEASYKYKVDKPKVHPLFEKETDPYAELFEDASVLSNKGLGSVPINLQD